MAHPTEATPSTMLATLEDAYGGRDSIADQLASLPDPRAQKIVAYLSDPQFKVKTLAEVAKACEVAPSTLLILLKDGAVTRAVAEASLRLQRRLPTVVDRVAEAAEGGLVPCRCTINKTVEPLKDCPACRGTGSMYVKPSLPHQELVLDVMGMLPKNGPAVQVTTNVQQNVAVGNIFDQFVKSPSRPAPINVTPIAIKE